MERLKIFFMFMLFVSFHAFSYDLSYLESKIPPDRFEMRIYEAIRIVIENGMHERKFNHITFVLNNTKVEIIENAPSKTRGYDAPDTIIIFTDQSLKTFEEIEEVVIVFNQKADFYRFIIRKMRSDNTLRSKDR